MIQTHVTLEPISHTYKDTYGNKYTSVSKVLESIQIKDDWNEIAGKFAGRGKFVGMTKEQVLKLWDDNRDKASSHGTRIHNALERFGNEFIVLEEDKDLEPMVREVYKEYDGYYKTYNEVCLYNPEFMVAGTSDKILVPSKNNQFFDVEDYKTNLSRGIEFKNDNGRFFRYPVSHLMDCSYHKYALQLSIYAYMAECSTGMTARRLWITYIEPTAYKALRIPTPYLKNDAINILKNFKQNKEFSELEQPFDL